ncbi:zf-RVT domain-containing protein, partial [Cephalotus follicularis]
LKGLNYLSKGLVWKLGNSQSIKVWTDNWIGDGLLANLIVDPIAEKGSDLRVADLLDDNRRWDFSGVSTSISMSIIAKIRAETVPLNSSIMDVLRWKGLANGVFSTKSAYNLLQTSKASHEDSWPLLWRVKFPHKLKLILWLTTHNRLLPNEVRLHCQLTDDAHCRRCLAPLEDCIHIFMDCDHAREV